MRISVVTPVLNEIRFIEGWYRNAKKFADEIIVVDTGSTDGTYEFLQSHDVKVIRWPKTYPPYCWPEHEIRNWLLKNSSGDWLVILDADDMVGKNFIESLNDLSSAQWLIGRYIYLQFWKDYAHVRARSLWPIIRLSRSRTPLPIVGRTRLGILRNWRGWYPNKVPKVCRRDDRIRYAPTGNHCILQYKDYGHWSYYMPNVTKNFDIGVHHFHFIFFGKTGGNRNGDKDKKVKTVNYNGILPNEIRHYKT